MIWILAFVLIVVVGLGYLVIMGDKPRYLRGKEVGLLESLACSFAIDHAEGSTLTMGYAERPELIEILKGPDTGEITQEVRLRVASAQFRQEERDAVVDALNGQGMVLAEAWDDQATAERLETTIRGTPQEIGVEARELAEAVVAGLQLGSDQRFTFKAVGDLSMQVWKRIEGDQLGRMARGGRLQRWLARKMNEAD